MTFSILLGNHRVKEACRRISEEGERYTTLTIEAIASGVGFKSRTAFINAFKREVGLTPSEYMRMANSEK
jgi:AraC-like DNA-binding protein